MDGMSYQYTRGEGVFCLSIGKIITPLVAAMMGFKDVEGREKMGLKNYAQHQVSRS